MTWTSNSKNKTTTIKFLYSYGGKILPRRTDGKLRYVGGFTRVLSVDRSVTFAELMVKFGELCGSSMILKCKLPSEDLDVLVSITTDEELANLIDEYDRFSLSTHKDLKVTAVLYPPKSKNKISPVSSVDDLCSTGSSAGLSPTTSTSTSSPQHVVSGLYSAPPQRATASCRYGGRNSPPGFYAPNYAGNVRCRPLCEQGTLPRSHCRCCQQNSPRQVYSIPRWNHCQ